MLKEKKKKILIVDNNPVLLKLMTNLLAKQEGHQVKTAENGLAALDVLGSFAPDIMFIDLIMPKINGAELCRIIRHTMPEFNDVPLVVLSAIAKESQEDMPPPADICIAKGPFSSTAKHVLQAIAWADRDKKSIIEINKLGFEEVFNREATTELLSWKKHFEVILNNMSDGIFEITNQDWRIIYANPRGIKLLGVEKEKLLGASLPPFFKKPHKAWVERLLIGEDEDSRKSCSLTPIVVNDRQVTMQILPIEDKGQDTAIVIMRDITERCLMEEKLRQMSTTDELTGLLNRRGFMTMANKQFQIADRIKGDVYLIFADLDNLKKINDQYGHNAGDRALLMVADVLRQSFRQSDIVGRLGGDEFAILTTGHTSGVQETGLCDRFIGILEQTNIKMSLDFEVKISAGVAKYDPNRPCSLDVLISRADFQMYKCKKNKQSM